MASLTTRGERLGLFASNALHCDSVFSAMAFGRLDRQTDNCAHEPLERAKTRGSAECLERKVSNYRGDDPAATFPLVTPPAG